MMTDYDAAAEAVTSADPYDTAHDWRCDDFATHWRVDVGNLRRALNLCAFAMSLTNDDRSTGQQRRELEQIAKTGNAFALAVCNAGDASIHRLMVLLVSRGLRNDVRLNPGRHRQMLVEQIQKLAAQANLMAGKLEVKRRRNTGKTTQKERNIVSHFAFLWHQTHGDWPKVTYGASNQAGRFVVAGANQFFGMKLSDQRLRTVLGSLEQPPAAT